MNDSQGHSSRRPVYVRFALWGLNSRSAAVVCAWVCLAVAAGSACFRFWAGLIFLVAAGWYWKAVRWVDRYGRWKETEE
jgi:hypothetical protein